MATTTEILARIKARNAEKARLAAIVAEENLIHILPKKEGEVNEEIGNAIAQVLGNDEPHNIGECGNQILDKYGNPIQLNEEQMDFVRLVVSGKSCVLIGAAGTGKTTSTNAANQGLLQANRIPPIPKDVKHKHLQVGAPGIVICAFTRRATNNIRANQSDELKGSCMTIHKLLQFEPVIVETYDEKTGVTKNSKVFEPQFNEGNPLPTCIKVIVIEEASMVGTPLWYMLMAAIQHEVQFVFLGDLNQLPPVFGPAILGFKLNELPVVELIHVYRQALDSPIIALAHRILSGEGIPLEELENDWGKRENMRIIPWKKKISPENATKILSSFIVKCINEDNYDPEVDGILIPFNKSCGTDELNKFIADALAKKEGKLVYEIFHKWKRSYFSVGDKCLYEKEDAIILDILPNASYAGALKPREPSLTLDYWGNDSAEEATKVDDIDALLGQVGIGSSDDEEGKLAASHVIKLHLLDSDRVVELTSAGQIAALILGFAITVHKAQGSEWKRVFFFLHHSHATMVLRELLYTAVTRAKSELIIVCEANSFIKGVENAKIKGTTLAEKAEYFKGKQEQLDKDGRSDNMD